MNMRRLGARGLLLWALPTFALACADAGNDGSNSGNDALMPEMRGLLSGDGNEFEEGASLADDEVAVAAASNIGVQTQALEEDTSCCSNADCVCRGSDPTTSTVNRNGPFRVGSYSLGFRLRSFGGGTVYYPTDATGALSAVVMCPGYTARQSSIADWGPFFASHGIVLLTIDTATTFDQVAQRADELLDALDELKGENTRTGSPLQGKLSRTRYGLAGWSMGGGGTWIATRDHPELKSAVTLAGHNATAGGALTAAGSRVPTLMLNGATDVTILGGLGQSEAAYNAIPNSTPKLLYVMALEGHFSWGTPRTNSNAAGRYVLAWEKVFLEGDPRYRKFLLERGPLATTFQSNLR
jgi:dienelactone hydrolase